MLQSLLYLLCRPHLATELLRIRARVKYSRAIIILYTYIRSGSKPLVAEQDIVTAHLKKLRSRNKAKPVAACLWLGHPLNQRAVERKMLINSCLERAVISPTKDTRETHKGEISGLHEALFSFSHKSCLATEL